MKFTAQQYAHALYDSLQSVSNKDHDRILDNFVSVLAANGDIKLHPQIEEEFHRLELKAKGTTLANVTSAHNLSKDSEQEIINHLNKVVSGKVELKKRIDERLIGGVVIQMEDTVIDASVKKSLEELKNNLEE